MKRIDKLFDHILKNKKTYVICATISIPLIVVLVVTSLSFYTTPLSYDEAYNLQVPVNLSKTGEYATNGGIFDGHTKVFDPYISTGPTLLLPIAAMFKLFSVDVWQFRIVMNVIYILFCVLAIWVVMKASRNKSFTTPEKFLYGVFATCLSIAILGNSIPDNNSFFFVAAQGEPLVLALLLTSVLLLQYRKNKSASLAIGLAILTKQLAILVMPFFLLYAFTKHKGSLLRKTIFTLYMAAIALAPTVLFEVYRFAALGFNAKNYQQSLDEYGKFFMMAGGDPSNPSSPLATIKERIFSLSSIDLSPYNITSIIIILFIIFAIYCFIKLVKSSVKIKINRKQIDKLNVPYIYIVGALITWCGWWLIMSSSPRARYIIIPIALSIIIGATLLYSYVGKYRKVINYLLLGIVVLACVVVLKYNGAPNGLDGQRRLSTEIVSEYNTRPIQHFGWWQNPDVQFFTHTTSIPYGSINDRVTEAWVLMSDLQHRLAPEQYTRDISQCNTVLTYNYYKICKINIAP